MPPDDLTLYNELKETINYLVPPTPRARFPKNDELKKMVKRRIGWNIPEKRIKNIRDLWYQRQDGERALEIAHK